MDKRKKRAPAWAEKLEGELAMMFQFGMLSASMLLKEHRIPADHPLVEESLRGIAEDLKRQYDRKLRAHALRRRRDWHKADIESLRTLFLVEGCARPAVQRAIARLMADGKTGRGVVFAKPFEQALIDGLHSQFRMVDPATLLEERKKSPWFPRVAESAYRGELGRLSVGTANNGEPHLPISEHAEDNIAKVAGISRAMVHQLCQQARDDYHGAERDRSITADELKRHLQWLPSYDKSPTSAN